jgi:hypothetical protein
MMGKFKITAIEEGIRRGNIQTSQQKDISQSWGHRPMTELKGINSIKPKIRGDY